MLIDKAILEAKKTETERQQLLRELTELRATITQKMKANNVTKIRWESDDGKVTFYFTVTSGGFGRLHSTDDDAFDPEEELRLLRWFVRAE